MTISPRHDNDNGGEGASNRRSSKKQLLPSVSEKMTVLPRRDGSSSSEEDEVECFGNNDPNESSERVLVVLSDDSDSEDETLRHFLRSAKRQKSSPKPLTLPTSDVLDCPTCLEPLRRPIFQCNNGHLACSTCCTKLKKKCTFCTLPIGDIRCRAMEKVLKACLVSCPNAKYGCKERTRYGKEETDHKKLCVFAPCSCPVRNCNYIGYYKDLNTHFHATHEQSPAEIMSFAFNRPMIFGLDHNDTVIFQEKTKGDLIVVQAFKRSNGVYVTVSHIAPMVKGIRKLFCSIAYVKEHSTLRLGYLVNNVQKVREQQEGPEDSFMLIPSHMLRGDHLKMQIYIGHEYAYTHM